MWTKLHSDQLAANVDSSLVWRRKLLDLRATLVTQLGVVSVRTQTQDNTSWSLRAAGRAKFLLTIHITVRYARVFAHDWYM